METFHCELIVSPDLSEKIHSLEKEPISNNAYVFLL